MATKDYEPNIQGLKNEVALWRSYFIDRAFSEEFENVPDYHKRRLSAYFLSVPSESFEGPVLEWLKCIGALLESIED